MTTASFLSASDTLANNLGRIADAAGKTMPNGYYAAAYGIAYAIQTCRVSAILAEKIEGFGVDALAELIDRIVSEKLTIGDVPRWLNANVS